MDDIKLLFGESLNLWRKWWDLRLKSWHAKDIPDVTLKYKKWLTIHSHLKCDFGHNEMNVFIEHANKMGVVSPPKKRLMSPILIL